jgi:hypothetical protein
VLKNLLVISEARISKKISSNYTLESTIDRIEVDATNANVTITLPVITDAYTNRNSILIKRIDDSLNTLTINGTSGNYEDNGIILFGLEGTTIYAGNDNIWRSTV